MQTRNFPDARILVADADPPARSVLVNALRAHGLAVDEAAKATEALQCLHSQKYTLLLLDPFHLGLSERELLKRARDLDAALILVILTAHPTIDSTIAAIHVNAFDYLIKPMAPDDVLNVCERALEMRAKQLRQERVLAMVRNVMSELDSGMSQASEAQAAPPAEKQWLMLDREKRIATLQTTPPQAVELTESEVALLSALMETPNHVLTVTQLAQVALGYNNMDKWTVESVIRSSIFRLRQKLEPSADAPKLIHTVRGRGYYFAYES